MVTLYPKADDIPFLHPREVAKRLFKCFGPNATADWKAGNDHLKPRLAELEDMGVHDAIIQGHKNLFGQVVLMRISTCNSPQDVQFLVYPDEVIAFDNNTPSHLVAQIAECLDYACGCE